MFQDPIRSTPLVRTSPTFRFGLKVQRADSALFAASDMRFRTCGSCKDRAQRAPASIARIVCLRCCRSSASSPGVSRIAVFPAQLRTRQQCAKTFKADVPFADVPVPVAATAQRHFGIVEMKHQQPDPFRCAVGRFDEIDRRRPPNRFR